MKPTLTHDRLAGLLSYDPEDGLFRWLEARGGVLAGAVAGGAHGTGYRVIGIDGRVYLAHRLVWLFVHRRWPSDQIDHINGIKHDNRLCNLREATTAENHQNMPRPRHNRSGAIGVSKCQVTGKWLAQITADGCRKTLGRFDTRDEASQAYRAAKRQIHKFQPTVREDMHQSDGLRAVAMHLRGVPMG